jgi:hypothetical protein
MQTKRGRVKAGDSRLPHRLKALILVVAHSLSQPNDAVRDVFIYRALQNCVRRIEVVMR